MPRRSVHESPRDNASRQCDPDFVGHSADWLKQWRYHTAKSLKYWPTVKTYPDFQLVSSNVYCLAQHYAALSSILDQPLYHPEHDVAL